MEHLSHDANGSPIEQDGAATYAAADAADAADALISDILTAVETACDVADAASRGA